MWITGQDVTTSGFAGALMGGVVTAHGILGYGFCDLVLGGRAPWQVSLVGVASPDMLVKDLGRIEGTGRYSQDILFKLNI